MPPLPRSTKELCKEQQNNTTINPAPHNQDTIKRAWVEQDARVHYSPNNTPTHQHPPHPTGTLQTKEAQGMCDSSKPNSVPHPPSTTTTTTRRSAIIHTRYRRRFHYPSNTTPPPDQLG